MCAIEKAQIIQQQQHQQNNENINNNNEINEIEIQRRRQLAAESKVRIDAVSLCVCIIY
jgi:hypothetical protein